MEKFRKPCWDIWKKNSSQISESQNSTDTLYDMSFSWKLSSNNSRIFSPPCSCISRIFWKCPLPHVLCGPEPPCDAPCFRVHWKVIGGAVRNRESEEAAEGEKIFVWSISLPIKKLPLTLVKMDETAVSWEALSSVQMSTCTSQVTWGNGLITTGQRWEGHLPFSDDI